MWIYLKEKSDRTHGPPPAPGGNRWVSDILAGKSCSLGPKPHTSANHRTPSNQAAALSPIYQPMLQDPLANLHMKGQQLLSPQAQIAPRGRSPNCTWRKSKPPELLNLLVPIEGKNGWTAVLEYIRQHKEQHGITRNGWFYNNKVWTTQHTDEAEENDLKYKFMKMMEALKEEIKSSL